MPTYDYDLICIGAGSGGVRASRMSSGMGARVAVVENMRTGGTCVMRGCVPKKLLIYGAHFAEDFENSHGFGWTTGDNSFDWSSLIAAKDKELDRLEGIYHNILTNAGVTELFGTGKIVDNHTIDVDGKTYTAETILVATGGWPSMPPVPGIEHVITSNEALDLPELPNRIVVVGGGFIAVEFAGIFNALGADVHIVIRAHNILRGFDESVRDALRVELEKKGITVHSGINVTDIAKQDDSSFRMNFDNADPLETDLIMYATGRSPITKGIGLENVDIELDRSGAIVVDEYSKTNVDNIYAIGDVTNRMNLTPVALAEGMAFAKTVYGGTPVSMAYENVPSAVFSQPPIGTVGLTEEQARARSDVDIYMSSFKAMKHTLSGSEERSMMKIIVDQKTDVVLGCHMMGADAPEIIQGIAIALKCGATKAQFDSTVGIHPTSAEEFVTMREKVAS
jgi:glutathione reductase (NADPH)